MLSIIIPNYNGAAHLNACLGSIQKQTFKDYKLIFVDNNSTDNSVELAKELIPDCEIVQIGYNSGFARAINTGIETESRKYNNPYILLLNNDTELKEDVLELGISKLKSSNAGMIAVKMLNFFDRTKIDDAGNFITRKGGSPYSRGRDETDKGQYDKEEFIFGPCAGAAFYKKEVFDHVGVFDRLFFAYFEDIDLSFRAQLEGYKCLYVPSIVCYHKRGGTSSVATLRFQTYYNERNLVLLRFKNYPLAMYIRFQPRFLFSRLYRYFLLLRDHGPMVMLSAIGGYFAGSFYLPAFIFRRFQVQRKKQVSILYLESLFR